MHVYIQSDWNRIFHSVQAQDFFLGPEVALSPSENEKQRFILKVAEEDGGSQYHSNVVAPYKKCIPRHGSMHAFITYYAAISPRSPKAVHDFLNVGHQRGYKVVTSGCQNKCFFSSDVFTIFIHSLPHGQNNRDILSYYES